MRSRGLLQLGGQAAGGERRRDPAQRGVGRRPGERGTRVEPVVVDAGGRQRLGQPPRLGDAELLEARRAARPRRRPRRARRAAVRVRRPVERLALQRDELLGLLALDPRLDEARRSSS